MIPDFSDVNAELSLSSPSHPSKNPPTTVTGSERVAEKNPGIKYVTWSFNKISKNWEYNNTLDALDVPAERVEPLGTDETEIDWEEYCFIVVRKEAEPQTEQTPGPWTTPNLRQTFGSSKPGISFYFYLQDTSLIKACQEVMGTQCGVSWNIRPVKLAPELAIASFRQLEEYYEGMLSSLNLRGDDDEGAVKSLELFVSYLRDNYHHTLSSISNLLSCGEITFDLFYAILIPGTTFVTRCPVTGELQALRLLSWTLVKESENGPFYLLRLESLETAMGVIASSGVKDAGQGFGMMVSYRAVYEFQYVEKIHEQAIYPMKYDPEVDEHTAMLVERGRKWANLNDVFHMEYRGMAVKAQTETPDYNIHTSTIRSRIRKRLVNINSRIMIDVENFPMQPEDRPTLFEETDHPMLFRSTPKVRLLSRKTSAALLDDEDLLLASTVVYGLSLSDNMWLAFNVNNVKDITWNAEAFESLVLQEDRKTLLRSLVEVSRDDRTQPDHKVFGDFVPGKGHGFVISLSGPPGVGKTLSAEAMSEHLRRPLYMVGSGQLSMSAETLNQQLGKACDLATRWNAVLLIDEADIFLEKRTMGVPWHNALVAVFLRHIEYHRCILFLTSNRVDTFDQAFLSRFHVALRFDSLTFEVRSNIWQSFLRKVGSELPDNIVAELAKRDLNGRQIKNVCQTASSLALSRGEKIQHSHLLEALKALEELVYQLTTSRIVLTMHTALHRLKTLVTLEKMVYVAIFIFAFYALFC